MATTDTRTMTLEEFLELPEEKPALEYEYGSVTQKMPPMGRHARLQLLLGMAFEQFGQHRIAAFTELRTTYGSFSRVPDVALYRVERIPLDERGRPLDRFTEPPDIAIEILSPGQNVTSQIRRCLEYTQLGVALAVLVDPDDESVIVVRPDGTLRAAIGDMRIDLDEVLPGFELTAAQLFDMLSFR